MSILVRLVFFALALALAGLIVIALPTGGADQAIAFLTATPWGRVTGLDLYLGFILAGAVIIAFERSFWSVLLAASILVLGNVVAALWFAWRWPELAQRLKP